MYDIVDSALAKENSLGWAGGDNSLIMRKDYLICLVLKVFIKEKEFHLTQGLHAHTLRLLVEYYLKKFNPTM